MEIQALQASLKETQRKLNYYMTLKQSTGKPVDKWVEIYSERLKVIEKDIAKAERKQKRVH